MKKHIEEETKRFYAEMEENPESKNDRFELRRSFDVIDGGLVEKTDKCIVQKG